MGLLSKEEAGQSIVELLFTVPIFLLFFAISYQMFAISWNAQYVSIRAREQRMSQVNHEPCGKGASGQSVQNLNGELTLLGGQSVPMKSTAVIVCQ